MRAEDDRRNSSRLYNPMAFRDIATNMTFIDVVDFVFMSMWYAPWTATDRVLWADYPLVIAEKELLLKFNKAFRDNNIYSFRCLCRRSLSFNNKNRHCSVCICILKYKYKLEQL